MEQEGALTGAFPLSPLLVVLIRGGERPQSKARHDLVLLLYCREQRFFSMTLSVEQRELFGGGWALPTAVMLAGGGGGGMSERVLGAPRPPASCTGSADVYHRLPSLFRAFSS